jgi:hypothetical protein
MTVVTNYIGLGMESSLAAEVGGDIDGLQAQTVSNAPTRSVSLALTATGTVIGDALDLVSLINVVSTTAAGTGVQLPDAPIGSQVIVQNNGANALKVWPHSGSGTLNGGSAGAAVTSAAAAGCVCTRLSSTDWLVVVTELEA